MSAKTIVISDCHISNDAAYSWFQERQRTNLLAKLADIANPPTDVEELVLLGDVFDLWNYPIESAPLTFKSVLELDVNSELVRKLQNCVDKLRKVYYFAGNHDMWVTQDDLQPLNPPCGAKTIILTTPPKYEDDKEYSRFLAHGHEVDMFNVEDPDGIDHRYPLGYFLTRLHASGSGCNGQAPSWKAKLVSEVVKCLKDICDSSDRGLMMNPLASMKDAAVATFRSQLQVKIHPLEGLIEAMIDELKGAAGLRDETEICLPESASGQKLCIKDVKNAYKGLITRWIGYSSYNVCELVNAAMANYELGWYAENVLSQEPRLKLVVMGHTHRSKSEEYLSRTHLRWGWGGARFPEGITVKYYNAGTWCDSGPCTSDNQPLPQYGCDDSAPHCVVIEGDTAKLLPVNV